MAIEYKGKVYRNLQEQVLKNKDDIVELIDGVSDITGAITNEIGDVVEQVSELNQEIAKTLKTPMAAPSTTKLVAIDTTNDQKMVSIGEGLKLENGTLSTSAVSSGKYLHVMNMFFRHDYSLPSGTYATVNVVLNTPENLSFDWAGDGYSDENKYVAFAQALNDVGLTYYRGLSFMGTNNYSLQIRPAEEPGLNMGVSNIFINNHTDGEELYANSMGLTDTVIPL